MPRITGQPAKDIGPQADHQAMHARPLEAAPQKSGRPVGRPAKMEMPALPELALNPVEQDLLDYFLWAYHTEFPDLKPTDNLILFLAAVEWIKYLRMIREELETGKLVTMSRQHPGVSLRGLLDQLSVTRKARTSHSTPPESDEARDRKSTRLNSSHQIISYPVFFLKKKKQHILPPPSTTS